MSLLKELIKEGGGGGGGGAGGGAGGGMGGGAAAGATSASCVAGARGSLFGGGGANTSKRRKRATSMNVVGEKPAKPVQMIRRLTKEGSLYGGGIINIARIKRQHFRALERAMSYIAEDITGSTDFDAADVVSKLDAAEKKAKLEKDTVTFGLENENGGLVRVYVRAEQADEFEQALSQMLASSDNNNDNENSSMEIAEVLFKLKDKFDIVDVNWGDIPEDEEQQEQQVVGGEAGGAPQGGAAGGLPGAPGGAAPGGAPGEENPIDQAAGEEGGEGLEGEGEEGEGDMTAGSDDEAKSALDSVIDMMKADAKAKQAEAEARAAEARAKEAEWTAKAAAAKVKQEEEVMDMETHEKEQKDMDKEVKRLAKLAKYRHDKANKYRDELGGSDDSADVDVDVDVNSEEEEEGGNRFPYDPAHVYGLANSRPKEKKVSLKQLRDMIYAHLRGDEH